VYACVGAFELPDPKAPVVITKSYIGAGWVMQASAPFEVDDRNEPILHATPEEPVPFAAVASSTAEMRIAMTPPISLDLLGMWSPDDLLAKRRTIQVQNVGDIEWLTSTFPNGAERTAPVAYHLNAMHLDVDLPDGTIGLMLSRVGDRFFGRQRARVLLDGEPLAVWYDDRQNRQHRWFKSSLPIPFPSPRPAGKARLSIDPPAGSPLFSFSVVTACAVLKSVIS
jgi:hypothetical protein